METILLAWNPARFPWGTFQDELATINRKGKADNQWSIGNRKSLAIGSRFFLIRLGVEPRGLVGAGWTTSAPYAGQHWDLDKAKTGAVAQYVDVYFETLVEEPLIGMDELAESPFSNAHWSTQMSGILIEESIAGHLETLWAERVPKSLTGGLEELPYSPKLIHKHSSRV